MEMITAGDLGNMMTTRMITTTSGETEMASAETTARGHAVAVTAAADHLGREVGLKNAAYHSSINGTFLKTNPNVFYLTF